jgi:hypothetical protein
MVPTCSLKNPSRLKRVINAGYEPMPQQMTTTSGFLPLLWASSTDLKTPLSWRLTAVD